MIGPAGTPMTRDPLTIHAIRYPLSGQNPQSTQAQPTDVRIGVCVGPGSAVGRRGVALEPRLEIGVGDDALGSTLMATVRSRRVLRTL